jgi:hypothetical protein
MYRRDLGREALALGAAAIGKPSIGMAQEPLPQLPPSGSLGLALNIPTVPNLRGYKTSDGASIGRGLAYRSDTFNPVSAEDIKHLERPSDAGR